VYPSYRKRLDKLASKVYSFQDRKTIFLDDRFGACHFLLPVLNNVETAFFTNGDDEVLQKYWAKENGLTGKCTLENILLAQIEHHKSEVFYNLDPMRYGSEFLRKLPSCVKKSIAWRAAPSPGADFGAYDAVVCNFPSILESYRQRGWRAEYFSPAHDPEMDAYAAKTERPIDVLFVGGYTRHHRQRSVILEAVASLGTRLNVVFCLDRSRLTRLAESPVGYFLPLSNHRRPLSIRSITHEPVFGRDLYKMISSAKIVLNGAVDMAGIDRGNMRCFEAMGCGALMVSDQGKYPEGMQDGKTMLVYQNANDVGSVITDVLQSFSKLHAINRVAHDFLRKQYDKQTQYTKFVDLAGRL
jgi:Glycosyl transferases group 1